MPELVIIVNSPGNETISCGGLLGKYAENNWQQKTDKDSPYIIFTSIYDYQRGNKFVTKQRQIEEIKEASKLLKFNWEVMYEGRKYYNGFYNTIDPKEYNLKLKNSLDFLQPNTVITLHNVSSNNDLLYIQSSVATIRKDFKFNHLGAYLYNVNYIGEPNQYIQIRPAEIDRKYKALLKYESIFDNDVFKIKKIIENSKVFGKRWSVPYVEPYYVYESLMEF